MCSPMIKVEISAAKIAQLIADGHLSGVDLHCQDPQMKAFIRQTCLKACVKKSCLDCPMQALCAHELTNQSTGVPVISFKRFVPSAW